MQSITRPSPEQVRSTQLVVLEALKAMTEVILRDVENRTPEASKPDLVTIYKRLKLNELSSLAALLSVLGMNVEQVKMSIVSGRPLE